MRWWEQRMCAGSRASQLGSWMYSKGWHVEGFVLLSLVLLGSSGTFMRWVLERSWSDIGWDLCQSLESLPLFGRKSFSHKYLEGDCWVLFSFSFTLGSEANWHPLPHNSPLCLVAIDLEQWGWPTLNWTDMNLSLLIWFSQSFSNGRRSSHCP